MRKSDRLIYYLSKKTVIVLFIYYFFLLIGGGIVTIYIAVALMKSVSQIQILKMSFVASLAVSGMLCSVQYIKRLYKACLTDRIISCNDAIKCIGNVAYFVFRPFFAFAFSVVMVFALLSGLFVVAGNLDYILNEKFVYLCVVVSGFLGFSVGSVLDKFEKASEEKVSSIMRNIIEEKNDD